MASEKSISRTIFYSVLILFLEVLCHGLASLLIILHRQNLNIRGGGVSRRSLLHQLNFAPMIRADVVY